MTTSPIQNALRRLRQGEGLSQQELADRAGVTRQTVSGIEAGRYLPSTAVALRMARALHCKVEDLFWLGEDDAGSLSAHLAQPLDSEAGVPETMGQDAPGLKGLAGRRVTTARIGDRWVAHLIPDSHPAASSWSADGLLRELGSDGPQSGRAAQSPAVGTAGPGGPLPIQLLRSRETLGENLLFVGCDPALGLLASRVRDLPLGPRLNWLHASSLGALQALERGEAHAAGAHMYSEEEGEFNIPFVRPSLPTTPAAVVNLAHMEEGFLVRPGNPLRIREVADLGRSDVRIINREPGSGARSLLDRLMRKAKVAPEHVKGYGRIARGHAVVAQSVAMGAADVGVGSRSAGLAQGLDFIPLSEERFDLVIPLSLMDDDRLDRVFDTLGSRPFRTELAALGGYQTNQSGELIAEVQGT